MPRDPDDSSRPSPAPGGGGEPRFGLLSWMRGIFGIGHPASIREELEDALNAEPGEAPDFSAGERTLLRNILALREIRVGDVMVPRADIVAIEEEVSLAELLAVFRRAEHSRLPVFRETLDEPRGLVHIKDVLAHLTIGAVTDPGSPPAATRAADIDLGKVDLSVKLSEAGLVRSVLYVPDSMRAVDLLADMQATRNHLALVIDEYGGVDGLLTIEDIIETIVGDIEDEHDHEPGPSIVQMVDGSFVADARTSLEDAVAIVGPGLASPAMIEEVDTLGGLLVMLAGRVPAVGERLETGGDLVIEVVEADPRRIKRVRIEPRRATESGTSAAPPTEAGAVPLPPQDPSHRAAVSNR
jgi:CBS domain containing-hemolysin-like protein